MSRRLLPARPLMLHVVVQIVGEVCSVEVDYLKRMMDPVLQEIRFATNRQISRMGTYGRRIDGILLVVSLQADRFVDEDARINGDACDKRP